MHMIPIVLRQMLKLGLASYIATYTGFIADILPDLLS